MGSLRNLHALLWTGPDRQSLPFLTLFQPLPFHLLSAICKSIVATLYKGEVAIGSLGYEPILSFCFLSAMKYI